MGNSSSSSNKAQPPIAQGTHVLSNNQNQNECSICLSVAAARGGVPLVSPGCCGQWFHVDCIQNLIASGDKKCPNCRAEFSGINKYPSKSKYENFNN